jgi:hypothetical protein
MAGPQVSLLRRVLIYKVDLTKGGTQRFFLQVSDIINTTKSLRTATECNSAHIIKQIRDFFQNFQVPSDFFYVVFLEQIHKPQF